MPRVVFRDSFMACMQVVDVGSNDSCDGEKDCWGKGLQWVVWHVAHADDCDHGLLPHFLMPCCCSFWGVRLHR
jgi:hypothetical protein